MPGPQAAHGIRANPATLRLGRQGGACKRFGMLHPSRPARQFDHRRAGRSDGRAVTSMRYPCEARRRRLSLARPYRAAGAAGGDPRFRVRLRARNAGGRRDLVRAVRGSGQGRDIVAARVFDDFTRRGGRTEAAQIGGDSKSRSSRSTNAASCRSRPQERFLTKSGRPRPRQSWARCCADDAGENAMTELIGISSGGIDRGGSIRSGAELWSLTDDAQWPRNYMTDADPAYLDRVTRRSCFRSSASLNGGVLSVGRHGVSSLPKSWVRASISLFDIVEAEDRRSCATRLTRQRRA